MNAIKSNSSKDLHAMVGMQQGELHRVEVQIAILNLMNIMSYKFAQLQEANETPPCPGRSSRC